jgi:hypothetical protein
MALAELVGKFTGNDSGESDEDFPENDEGNNPDGPDPKAKRPEAKEKPKGNVPAVRIPPHVRKEITETVDAYVEILTAGWSLTDDYCSSVMDEQRPEVVERIVKIICKHPAWVRALQEGDGLKDWFLLAVALKPVGQALWLHHVSKEVADNDQQDVTRYAAPPIG